MTCEEHKNLANKVKRLHASLRIAFRNDKENLDEIWENHCRDKKQLSSYAAAMYCLATTYWEQNNSFTRINWCYEMCKDYFFNGFLQRIIEKNKKKLVHFGHNICEHFDTPTEHFQGKLRLLDVGSCYNPFKLYSEFETLAIDLIPAKEDVHQCDFLKVQVKPVSSDLKPFTSEIECLPEGYFHIVVFSLLLEYFPSSRQRWNCCVKARQLLMPNGLLLIISPDSKHQNHNSGMIKHWKIALEHLGFERIIYKKLAHIHCMGFRAVNACCLGIQKKSLCSSAYCRTWSSKFHSTTECKDIKEMYNLKTRMQKKLNPSSYSLSNQNYCLFSEHQLLMMLYIPQDFNENDDKALNECKHPAFERSLKDDEILKKLFEELPEIEPE